MGWYKDCKTGEIGTGTSYELARQRALAKSKIPTPKISPNLKILGTGSSGIGAQGSLKKPITLRKSVTGTGGSGIGAGAPVRRPINPRRITPTGRAMPGPSAGVRTPPIDLRSRPAVGTTPTVTTTTQTAPIQDVVQNTPNGQLIIMGLAAVVLIVVLGGR